MTPNTVSAARRARAALVVAAASILFPAMAHGATRNVDKTSAACDDTAGAPFCTIQAAINAASPNDRIEIAAGSYIETLAIDRNLTLHGAGISAVERACDGQTNLLGAPAISIGVGVIALVTDVTVKGGTASLGGGVSNAGVLFLASSEVCQNSAFNLGGGIYTSGALSLTRVQVYDNQQASAGVEGGGLFVQAGGRALVRNSTFTNNRVARGGGISVAFGGTLLLSRSTLTQNFADGTLPSVVSSRGGGLNNSGIAIIDQTEIGEGNTVIDSVGLGGGIFNDGILVMARSTLRENGTDHEPSVPLATGLGGGLHNTGLATISSSTVSGNLFNPSILGFGAGISNTGTLSLSNVTITNNANSGAGIGGGAGLHLNGGSVRVRNSIIAAQAFGNNCGSSVTTDGYNIDSDGTCGLVDVAGGGTDQPNVADAGLLPLGEYGGPTRTHDLADTSPAVDGGNPAGCMADPNGVGPAEVPLTADQRGRAFVEIAGIGGDPSGCDIGAVEFQPAP
jgi:predicted outer membrane repeat protein